jgi:predicted  nucleic acid-binding Zn-ribbon protein
MAKSTQPTSSHKETLDDLLDRLCIAREDLLTLERSLERLRSDITKMTKQSPQRRQRPSAGLKSLATLRAFHQLKIYPIDQIRRDGESALRAFRIQRRPHFFQIDFS